ncbi:hypothetical protein KE639_00056 [Streptomyces sp. V17-9]|nr:hypothetical protein KE639_00056 [Streptomyces sp. V17-9]
MGSTPQCRPAGDHTYQRPARAGIFHTRWLHADHSE